MNSEPRRVLPVVTYACVLGIAVFLYYLASHFDYTPRAGAPGPDAWPKGILALMIATCIYGIIKSLFFAGADEGNALLEGVVQEGMEAPADAEADAASARYPHLLVGGIVVTLGYVFFVDKLGFFLTTLVYLVVFLLLGRYRRWRAIAGVSLIGSIVLMYVFMKIVYVSLPLGVGPFGEFSVLLMKLMGIR
jgi:putative tricarboxylic transport membrane protein